MRGAQRGSAGQLLGQGPQRPTATASLGRESRCRQDQGLCSQHGPQPTGRAHSAGYLLHVHAFSEEAALNPEPLEALASRWQTDGGKVPSSPSAGSLYYEGAREPGRHFRVAWLPGSYPVGPEIYMHLSVPLLGLIQSCCRWVSILVGF